MTDSRARVAALSDVDLVRMLTLDTTAHTAEVLAAAEAEAVRRDLPIDAAFIPLQPDESTGAGTGAEPFHRGGRAIVCTQCQGTRFHRRDILLNTRPQATSSSGVRHAP